MEKTMKFASLVWQSVIAGALLLTPQFARAQDLRGEIDAIVRDYLAAHPDEVGKIATDYLTRHPEVMTAILAQMLRQRATGNAPASAEAAPAAAAKSAADRSAAVAGNTQELFSSPHQVNLGNPDGDITLVEFFDYNCGFCKHALPDMLSLLKSDSKLKVVLKEFPILGVGSSDAARVAVAIRMQDPSGTKYLAFHQELLGGNGPVSKEKALATAQALGLDMARLETDMASDEVTKTLNEDMKLASALGITGTPSYVIGKDVLIGAVGVAGLQGRIDAARGHAVN
jgi:protein-disulfide isomerase